MTEYQPITKKTSYYNAGDKVSGTIFGSPYNHQGWVGSFSTSNYIIFNCLKAVSIPKSFEIQICVSTPTTYTTAGRIINPTNGADSTTAPYIQINETSASIYWYNGSTYSSYIALSNLSPSTLYWFKWVYNGSTIKSYWSTDKNTWTLNEEKTLVYPIYFKSTEYSVGCRSYDSNSVCVWNGSIYLKDCFIKIDDEYLWTGTCMNSSKGIWANGLMWGNLGFVNGKIMGFNSTNKFRLENSFNPGSNTWEWRMKLRTSNVVSNAEQFIGGGTNDGSGLEAGIRDGHWTWWLGTALGTYDIASNQQSSYSVIPNTDYYVKLYFTGTQYKFDYSLDGVTYYNGMTKDSTATIVGDYKGLGADYIMNGAFWSGSIDLRECSVYINNQKWWDGTVEIPAPTAASHVYEVITEKETPLIRKQLTYFKKTNKINGEVIGAVLNGLNGETYNFAQNNYIRVGKYFNPGHKSWEIVTHFNTGGAYNDNKVIIDLGDGGTTRAITLYIRASSATDGYAKKMVVGLKSGSSSSGPWIRTETGCSHVFEFNTTYWYKLSFDGVNLYKGEVSTDGTTWETDFTVTNDTPVFPSNTILLGQWAGYAANTYFAGTIYMKDCYIKIGDEYFWRGTVNIDKKTPVVNGAFSGNVYIRDGKMSNISSTNYITLPQTLNTTLPWEFKVAFKFERMNADGARIIGKNTSDLRQGMVVGTNNETPNNIRLWLNSAGSSWDISPGTANTSYYIWAGRKYYMKVRFTGTQYILDMSTDDVNYQNLFTINSSTPIYSTVPFDLASYGNCYVPGVIYLKDCYINSNGQRWWSGTTDVTPSASNYDYTEITEKEYIPVTKKTKYYKSTGLMNGSVVGTGLQCTQDGILKGFTTSRYFCTQNIDIVWSRPFEIVEKVRYVESGTTSQSFWFCKQYWGAGGYVNGTNKHLQIYMSTNGSSWNLASEVYGTYTFVNNTDYWIRLRYTGAAYYWEVSTNGVNFTTDITINNGTPLYPAQFWFGLSDVFSAPWLGTIDLKGTYIKQDGKYLWRGTKYVCKDTIIPNGIINGNVIIDGNKMRCYENTSGLLVSNEFNPGSNPWTLAMKFRMLGDVTSDSRPFSTNVDFRCTHAVLRDGTFYTVTTTNGSSWNITNSGFTVQPYTTYWVKQSFTGTEYVLSYSLDGINYIQASSIASTSPVTPGYVFFNGLGWTVTNNLVFRGITYLDDTYLEINGQKWWSPTILSPSSSNYDYTEIG